MISIDLKPVLNANRMIARFRCEQDTSAFCAARIASPSSLVMVGMIERFLANLVGMARRRGSAGEIPVFPTYERNDLRTDATVLILVAWYRPISCGKKLLTSIGLTSATERYPLPSMKRRNCREWLSADSIEFRFHPRLAR